MGGQQSKPETVGKKVAKAVDKAADKTAKAVDKAADKVADTVSVFHKKVEKALEPDRKQQIKDAAPVVGVVALAVAVGAYLYKTKPWKKGGAA